MAISFYIRYKLTWIFITVCFIRETGTQCNSSNRFGPNCDFECHCMNNKQCNSTTGNCPSGCDFAWVGPACQHRNIVPIGFNEDYMVARHQSNIGRQFKIAALAVDKDLSTCSFTNYANKSVWIPWWRIWLKDNHRIRKISIVTGNEYLDYFRNFQVFVENNTGKFWNGFTSQKICYTHDKSAPITTSIDVTCTHAIYGNQLRIKLAANDTQLVLCDVRMYGDCTDGTFGNSCTELCSTHCQNICNEENGTCSTCEPGWTEDRCNNECPDGTYGFECALNCSEHCVNGSTCLNTNGFCIKGCDIGWVGRTCIDKCIDGYYGYACLQRCSTNCVGGYSNCDKIYGSCMSGCIAGWSGRKCEEECPAGIWGMNCANTCGYCESGDCRNTDGVCERGCAEGVKNTPHCDEECDNGTYGSSCSSACSKNCKDVCKKQTGECEDCRSGWHGPKCTLECEDGRWGENCKRTCFTCHNGICNRINGACDRQCKPGFKETAYCDQECSDGRYGYNCSEVCSIDCKNYTFCSKTDGSCSECKPGLEGKMCENGIKQPVMMISGGGIAGIVLAVIFMIFLSVLITVVATRKGIYKQRNHNQFENETVSYSNVLAAESISTSLKTQESSLTMEMENVYDTIKRKSGIEHTYD